MTWISELLIAYAPYIGIVLSAGISAYVSYFTTQKYRIKKEKIEIKERIASELSKLNRVITQALEGYQQQFVVGNFDIRKNNLLTDQVNEKMNEVITLIYLYFEDPKEIEYWKKIIKDDYESELDKMLELKNEKTGEANLEILRKIIINMRRLSENYYDLIKRLRDLKFYI